MNTHHLSLIDPPFRNIKLGKKTIESRLFDEKRQKIQIGDHIILTNREGEHETIEIVVTNIFRHQTFRELFTAHPITDFGHNSLENAETEISRFYTLGQQRQYGVIGIEFHQL